MDKGKALKKTRQMGISEKIARLSENAAAYVETYIDKKEQDPRVGSGESIVNRSSEQNK